MKTILSLTLLLALTACATDTGNGGPQVYGEIKTGVEGSRTK